MALYDGFFDATQNDSTGEYDRAYGSDDFTSYFAKIVGSGVCVHNDPNSFKVRMEDGQAIVSPGYLFIDGYWLRNDADYTIALPGSGNYAIVAYLNLGKRMIELEARTVDAAYTGCLVLSIVSPTAAEDTRYNTDLCGVINTAGELSSKAEWALNYIDNEIEGKLANAEQEIAAQAAKLDAQIVALQAIAGSIVPPAVGAIKFSASQDVDNTWLPCDGRFINEANYPELVEALGKLTPSADKFKLISDGEIGPQISNGVVYDGKMWVYSYSTRKLYGVDLSGDAPIKEIEITSDDPDFTRINIPTASRPIALSIVKSPIDGSAKIFLAQILTTGTSYRANGSIGSETLKTLLWLYYSDFSGQEDSVSMSMPFSEIDTSAKSEGAHFYFKCGTCVPYIISENDAGKELFSMVTGMENRALSYVRWHSEENTAVAYVKNHPSDSASVRETSYLTEAQRSAFNKKSKDDAAYVLSYSFTITGSSTVTYNTYTASYNKGTFSRDSYTRGAPTNITESPATPTALNIFGEDKVLFEPSITSALVMSLKNIDLPKRINFGISMPSSARIFVDAASYLWGKDIYMIFVGTGIIFSRTLEEGDFGYLDTTNVLGTITQFGYLDYSQDEGTLYLLGQDTTNSVKVAKIVLNTLYDYANDGAWLPMIAADGVPAYIKAKEDDAPVVSDVLKVSVNPSYTSYEKYVVIEVNGEIKTSGTYEYQYPGGTGTITVSIRAIMTTPTSPAIGLSANSTSVAVLPKNSPEGTTRTVTLNVSSYMESGLILQAVGVTI